MEGEVTVFWYVMLWSGYKHELFGGTAGSFLRVEEVELGQLHN
jgi:hypothetical protein